ncbi:MAG: helix-turn-helix domain-containing protein [Rhodocyclaceae bacterium]|nr:helix-turn-helix domain-containing protein [Rhodocyclaceae bacterium]
MARPKSPLSDLSAYRKATGLNQSDFWRRFGVTQSGGSRYESGRNLPNAVGMLLWLVDKNKLGEADLKAALNAVNKR